MVRSSIDRFQNYTPTAYTLNERELLIFNLCFFLAQPQRINENAFSILILVIPFANNCQLNYSAVAFCVVRFYCSENIRHILTTDIV